jgi:hypothetical protein
MIDGPDRTETRPDGPERARRCAPARRRWETPVVIVGEPAATQAANQGPHDGGTSSILS